MKANNRIAYRIAIWTLGWQKGGKTQVATRHWIGRWRSISACNKQFTPNLHWCYNALKVSVFLALVFISICFHFNSSLSLYFFVVALDIIFKHNFNGCQFVLFLLPPFCFTVNTVFNALSATFAKAEISMYRKKHQKFSSFVVFFPALLPSLSGCRFISFNRLRFIQFLLAAVHISRKRIYEMRAKGVNWTVESNQTNKHNRTHWAAEAKRMWKKLKNWQSPKCSFTMFYLIFHYCFPYTLPSHSFSLLLTLRPFLYRYCFLFFKYLFLFWFCCWAIPLLFRLSVCVTMDSLSFCLLQKWKSKKMSGGLRDSAEKSASFQFRWNKSWSSKWEKPIM